MLAGAADGLQGAAEVADVVEGVEDAEDVHAVLRRFVHEAIDDAVLVVAVAEQVLPAQQHLQARVGQELAEGAQALPGVLVEEADAGVVGGPAPALDAPVASPVDVGAGRGHVLQGHPRGQETLVAIAQDQLGDLDSAGHGAGLLLLIQGGVP